MPHKSERKVAKGTIGPTGGLKCSCCRPVGTKKESKVHLAQLARRIAKNEVTKNLKEHDAAE